MRRVNSADEPTPGRSDEGCGDKACTTPPRESVHDGKRNPRDLRAIAQRRVVECECRGGLEKGRACYGLRNGVLISALAAQQRFFSMTTFGRFGQMLSSRQDRDGIGRSAGA